MIVKSAVRGELSLRRELAGARSFFIEVDDSSLSVTGGRAAESCFPGAPQGFDPGFAFAM